MNYYFTSEQLKQMQNKSFGEKVLISQSRIMKMINDTKGKIYVAYSGGKDSGVVLDMVAQIWGGVEVQK